MFFFNNYYVSDEHIDWVYPWILLSFFTAVNLLITPIYAFMQGLGKVKDVAKIRLIQQSIVYLCIYCGFIFGFKLYIPALQSFVLAFIGVVLIFSFKFHKILAELWKVTITEKVVYSKEIFPFQWKIAISWISGYFIYQLFNPVLFAYQGAVIAGQMGMTLAVLNGVQALSNSWMTTKIPTYSGFIAQKQYKKLDFLFNTALKQSVFINLVALLILYSSVKISRYYSLSLFGIEIGKKVLEEMPLLFMILSVFINQFVFSWALYLRCHKKEPFLFYSIVMAVLSGLSTFFMTKYFGVEGMTFGYFAITFILFYWAYFIFKTKKHEWHN
jgi:O-antigen/teichoic acid export membrane protein